MAKRRKGSSVAGAVKQYLLDHPEWLASTDTHPIVAQFQRDHPQLPVDKRVMQAIYNVKTAMRKGENGIARKRQAATAQQANAAASGKPNGLLTQLEGQIDDCMMLAKQIGKEPMETILASLHRARNAVVVMLEG